MAPSSFMQPVAVYIILLSFFSCKVNTSTWSNVYLNSYGHCGHDKTFPVTPDKGYWIRPDVNPMPGTKSFRDCETNLYSRRDKGRLCLVQEGRASEIGDSNAELQVHDGYSDEAPLIFVLKHYPDYWGKREYCTKSRYINFYLRKINKTRDANIEKIHIDLKVVDIQSPYRKLFLDELYCNQTYPFMKSEVSISNLPPQGWNLPVRTLQNYCWLQINKEKTEERSICLVYVPFDSVDCSSDWSFSVAAGKISQQPTDVLYQLHCSEKRAKNMHVWCAGNDTHSAVLIFQRRNNIMSNSSLELPDMFRFVLADYQGSAESFLEKVKRDLAKNSGDGISLGIGWIIFIVVVLIVLIAVTIVIIYRSRSRLPCVEYKAVHNPNNSKVV